MAAQVFEFDAPLPALSPRDALHLVTMARHDVDSIVTTDEDFLPVDELRIFTCNPSLLARR
jgi:predicted nucleic acid-binding protein